MPRRVIHWVGFVGIFLVSIITGAFMFNPTVEASPPMTTLIVLHTLSGIMMIALTMILVYLIFLSPAPRRAELGLGRQTWWGAWVQLRYLTLPGRAPATFRLNDPIQTLVYLVWLAVFSALALSGIALWSPGSVIGEGLTGILGGGYAVRMGHVFTAAAFIAILIIHIYIAVLDATITKNGTFSSIISRRSSNE